MAEKSYEKIFNLLSILEEITDFEKTLQITSEYLKKIFNADEVSILMVNPITDSTIKTIYSANSVKLAPNAKLVHDIVTGWVLKNKFSFNSGDSGKRKEIEKIIRNADNNFSVICTPMKNGGKTIGVVFVMKKSAGDFFNDSDVSLLENYSSAVSPFINSTQDIKQYFSPSLSKNSLVSKFNEFGMIGSSEKFVEVLKSVEVAAKCSVRVIIQGKSGTGKELVAKAIHNMSSRAGNKFVAIDCGAMPTHLIESELFGHVKGAFTGADFNRIGLFEEADNGTLFMDEIANLPFETQSKLLRILQENEVRPLGSNQTKKIDVRLITASSSSIKENVEKGEFREDLYYRLFVFPIYLPTLNERSDDIPMLANHFLKKYSRQNNKDISGFSDDVMSLLANHVWKGNIRELENYIERIVAETNDGTIEIDLDNLSGKMRSQLTGDAANNNISNGTGSYTSQVTDFEFHLIFDTLKEANWNQSEAARKLGIPEQTLRYKMKKYNINKSNLRLS